MQNLLFFTFLMYNFIYFILSCMSSQEIEQGIIFRRIRKSTRKNEQESRSRRKTQNFGAAKNAAVPSLLELLDSLTEVRKKKCPKQFFRKMLLGDGSIIGEHKNGPFSICVFLTGKHIYIQLYITSILSEGAIQGLIIIMGEENVRFTEGK